MQDEHPALPETLTGDTQGYLLECFQKELHKRPDAEALLSQNFLIDVTTEASLCRTSTQHCRRM